METTTEKTVAMETAHLQSWQFPHFPTPANGSFAYMQINILMSASRPARSSNDAHFIKNVASFIENSVQLEPHLSTTTSIKDNWIIYKPISVVCTRSDSWFLVLSKVFSVQPATTKRPTAKCEKPGRGRPNSTSSGFLSNWRPTAATGSESYYEFERPYRDVRLVQIGRNRSEWPLVDFSQQIVPEHNGNVARVCEPVTHYINLHAKGKL